jgi:hypothetical protein
VRSVSDLYDADILEWSERQAAPMQRVAAGEPPNVPPDWANIIEERAESRSVAERGGSSGLAGQSPSVPR